VVAGERGGRVAQGKVVQDCGCGAGQVTAGDAAAAQVGGRRCVDVDFKPLDEERCVRAAELAEIPAGWTE